MKKFFAISIVLMAISAGVFAQATATATATIVTPITITKTTDMSFGNIVPSTTLAGTVVLAPDGTPTYTNVTATALPTATATISAASFDVAGTPGASYTISLPAVAVTLTGPAGTMTADNFTSSPATTGTLDATLGTQVLTVGATLNVAANQAAGTYTTGATPFTVTVNYN